jgi:hypothetical protein
MGAKNRNNTPVQFHLNRWKLYDHWLFITRQPVI